jgi:tetratricopeptide (TPR) repeat protein
VLIRTTVDAAQGIEGALPIDALDDLIEETVQLNSSRHRTFFHVGFRDAVLRRPLQVELPAQNVERRIAYWSGYLQGLGRQERWTEIVTHFDEHDLATWLGAHAQGATAYVLFEALRRAGRSYEAAAFLTPGAVLAVPMLRIGLLTEGTHLLREDRAAEARPIFDLLATAIAAMEHLGHDTGGSFFQDARRRRANCYRQLGQLEYASHLLRELLKSAAPNVRPMVLADLGLIDAGVRRLADLVLPADRESLASFTSAIERGETRFREVLQSQDLTVGHARYCLGVLALAKGRGADAVTNLELALSLFEARANVYRLGGLLRNARLYLGIAICQTVEVHRMRRASELVREAVKEGAHIPSYLLTDTLTALSLAEDALAREVAEEILRGSSPAVLDALLNADVASGSEPIVSALLTRSMDEKRGDDARTKDACQVLPLLLQQDRTGDAAIVLDYLEEAAQRGRCRVEYIAMLEHSECLEPAWSAEDTLWCRVGILEATGRYEDAARILTQEFHRTLSVGASAGETEAEGILDRILTYGNQEHVAAPLRGRLEALRRVRGSAEQMSPDSGPGFPVRILVVGGDERQAIYDGPIREELNAVDPGITVDFIHPGWSGHWNGVLEDVKRSLARSDGVVVMRLNRTMFAREVRAACAVPWRGCGGRGKTAILNSILAVASMARQAAIRA